MVIYGYRKFFGAYTPKIKKEEYHTQIDWVYYYKTTFDYRLKGLLTNMEQVKTLCGFEVCAFVFGLGDTKHSIWPSIMI
jgi:hypothetical protein